MTDIRTILRQAAETLGDRLEAELLLAHALGVNRAWFFAHAEDVPNEPDVARFDALVRRRAEGEPVAYIVGRRDFWSLPLEVTTATLIPRPETELLVELVIKRLPQGGSVVDLGTGSGAIALAIAKERPDAIVTAVDASEAALEVARRNAQALGLQRVAFHHGDWLAPLAGQRFDLIVSNPPYIEADDPHLAQGDLRFEPTTALASGADGLDDIRRIAAAARGHLCAGGRLLVEHGWNQGEAVREIFRASGLIDAVTSLDLEGRDRVTEARVNTDATVFHLYHLATFRTAAPDRKTIGVYGSRENAMAAAQRAGTLPGFSEYPGYFCIEALNPGDQYFAGGFVVATAADADDVPVGSYHVMEKTGVIQERAFLVFHEYERLAEIDRTKFIGVFASAAEAERAIDVARSLPGFREFPDGFSSADYHMDADHWLEGFARM